jgi:hypothetical protein
MQQTRSSTRREFMTRLVDPLVDKAPLPQRVGGGDPNEVYTLPKQAGMPEHNRALQVTTKNDQQKDYYIGIKDIDEAVMWYFKNVLKLSVIQNNTRVEVPVVYGNAEIWKLIQRDGFYRDKENKILAPIVLFKRETITQNRNLSFKLDGNSVHNVQLFEKGYSKRNFYSNFPLLKKNDGRKEEKEYTVSMVPDYVTVEYSCIVWTYYIEQMDKLIEALNFASRGYWGDPSRFQFYSEIETFTEEIVYGQGEDRAIKNTFNIKLNGYLIPDSINKTMATANRVFGYSQLVFGLETANSVGEFKHLVNKSTQENLANMIAADGVNRVVNQYTIDATSGAPYNEFLAANNSVVGQALSDSTAQVPGSWMPVPPELQMLGLSLSKNSFTYYVNGQLIPITAVVDFTSSGLLTIDPVIMGFGFITSPIPDEIVVVGKII